MIVIRKFHTLGLRIRAARLYVDYTAIVLSKMIKITCANIYKYETSKAIPSDEEIRKFATSLNVSYDYLVKGIDSTLSHEELIEYIKKEIPDAYSDRLIENLVDLENLRSALSNETFTHLLNLIIISANYQKPSE